MTGAVVAILIVAIAIPPIGGSWTIDSAITEVSDAGYAITDPTGTILVNDVLPNTDSTYIIGDLGNEFAELYIDALYLNGHEVAISGMSDVFMDCLVVSATHVRADEDLSAGLPITFTLTLQPDVPRTLSGHFDSHAQITHYTITITGVNGKGDAVSEILTEVDLWDWETDHAYATITSIVMSVRTGTGVGDTMDIGITDVLGLSNNVNAAADVYKIQKNNTDEAVVGGDVNVTYDTYDMATAVIGAADDFVIWYDGNISFVD